MAECDKLMKGALKKVLIPHLQKVGFAGKYPHFRRKINGGWELISILFSKHGGYFFIEAAQLSEPLLKEENVTEKDLDIAYAPLKDRARLQERVGFGSNSEDWFKFAHFGSRQELYIDLANHVMNLFPQVERWLSNRSKEINVNPMLALYPVHESENFRLLAS